MKKFFGYFSDGVFLNNAFFSFKLTTDKNDIKSSCVIQNIHLVATEAQLESSQLLQLRA